MQSHDNAEADNRSFHCNHSQNSLRDLQKHDQPSTKLDEHFKNKFVPLGLVNLYHPIPYRYNSN